MVDLVRRLEPRSALRAVAVEAVAPVGRGGRGRVEPGWFAGRFLVATWRTFDGPFSAASTPPIPRVGDFFFIFRDLQDLHSFAPFGIQQENHEKRRSKLRNLRIFIIRLISLLQISQIRQKFVNKIVKKNR